jgi:hypothetical protein
LSKKILERGRAFILENTGRDFAVMIQCGMLKYIDNPPGPAAA